MLQFWSHKNQDERNFEKQCVEDEGTYLRNKKLSFNVKCTEPQNILFVEQLIASLASEDLVQNTREVFASWLVNCASTQYGKSHIKKMNKKYQFVSSHDLKELMSKQKANVDSSEVTNSHDKKAIQDSPDLEEPYKKSKISKRESIVLKASTQTSVHNKPSLLKATVVTERNANNDSLVPFAERISTPKIINNDVTKPVNRSMDHFKREQQVKHRQLSPVKPYSLIDSAIKTFLNPVIPASNTTVDKTTALISSKKHKSLSPAKPSQQDAFKNAAIKKSKTSDCAQQLTHTDSKVKSEVSISQEKKSLSTNISNATTQKQSHSESESESNNEDESDSSSSSSNSGSSSSHSDFEQENQAPHNVPAKIEPPAEQVLTIADKLKQSDNLVLEAEALLNQQKGLDSPEKLDSSDAIISSSQYMNETLTRYVFDFSSPNPSTTGKCFYEFQQIKLLIKIVFHFQVDFLGFALNFTYEVYQIRSHRYYNTMTAVSPDNEHFYNVSDIKIFRIDTMTRKIIEVIHPQLPIKNISLYKVMPKDCVFTSIYDSLPIEGIQHKDVENKSALGIQSKESITNPVDASKTSPIKKDAVVLDLPANINSNINPHQNTVC